VNNALPAPPIGQAILSLLMLLVALLGWMLAGSTLLADTVEGLQADLAVVWFSVPLGAAYMALAWAILRQLKWALPFSFVLLCAVLSIAIADLERPGQMALDSSLTMLMAAVASMVAILVLSFPRLEQLAQARDTKSDGADHS
jgi:uncharacterized membrane protein